MNEAIRYSIVPSDPAAHLFLVTLTVEHPDPMGQQFTLPAWIPGSYMIREFARNIVRIRAESDGKEIRLEKLDKHTWRAFPCSASLTLHYEVYAWDLSVRAAHLDQSHGFFNGTSVFLRVHDQENRTHIVDIQRPVGDRYGSWRVATALSEAKARRYGFGTYVAQNYDELIDHPVEMGDFALATFRAHGVAHDIVVTGKIPNLDMARLSADLRKICESQIALFEPDSNRPPMKRYVFMTLAVADAYGGLEHRASTALICARADLPVKGQKEMSDGYRTYLGLCSHEYFHTWNVKRIKPAVFAPYDYQVEAYTSLLWLFEGFTSYYDDLMLVRSGVIDGAAYCTLLAKTVNGVLRGSGRTKQSVSESSFDAWIKYYRQDENASNAVVSYYTKGSLVGLGLDLTIRRATHGRKSLDDVMRALWERYGRAFYSPEGGRGIAESEVRPLFEEVTGVSLKRFFDRYISGTDDLPLAELLPGFGLHIKNEPKHAKPSLGVRTSQEGGNTKIATVYEHGPAHMAGLSAGDVLVAIDGLRVTATSLDNLLGRYRVGNVVAVHVFRGDVLNERMLTLAADEAPQWSLTAKDKMAASERRLRVAWLGG